MVLSYWIDLDSIASLPYLAYFEAIWNHFKLAGGRNNHKKASQTALYKSQMAADHSKTAAVSTVPAIDSKREATFSTAADALVVALVRDSSGD